MSNNNELNDNQTVADQSQQPGYAQLIQQISNLAAKVEAMQSTSNVAPTSSSHKTSLGLNQWDATDPIKREDFNKDNEIINEILEGKADKGYVDAQLTNKANIDIPQKYSLQLADGYKVSEGGVYRCVFYKTQESLVVVEICVSREDGSIFPPGAHGFANLPVGFRSSNVVHFMGFGNGGTNADYPTPHTPVSFWTSSTGIISATVGFNATRLFATLVFLADG